VLWKLRHHSPSNKSADTGKGSFRPRRPIGQKEGETTAAEQGIDTETLIVQNYCHTCLLGMSPHLSQTGEPKQGKEQGKEQANGPRPAWNCKWVE
jgi:hypothetical protein